MLQKYLSVSISKRVLLFSLMGVLLGIGLRFYPSALISVGIDADKFKALGLVFINLIKMVIGPLVFASISASILNVKDAGSATKLGFNTVLSFVFLTLISCAIGLVIVHLFHLGKDSTIDVMSLISSNSDSVGQITSSSPKVAGLGEFIFNIVPSNLFSAFYTSNFLQIIFFAVVFSIAVRACGEVEGTVTNFILSFDKIVLSMSKAFSELAPIAVFGFITWLVATQSIALIMNLGSVLLAVYAGVLIMVYVVYAIALSAIGLNPIKFFKKILPNQIAGFFISSTSAMIPANLTVLQDQLGVPESKASFVIPLGATINMNGTALNLSIVTIFIANLFGVDFSFSQIVMLVITILLASVGTAPVPSASLFLLAGILAMFGIPAEAIGVILAVDRMLDMARTLANFSGDLFTAVFLSKIDKSLDIEKYNS